MTWKTRSTSESTYVDIDLDDFDTGQLLQALINRKVIDEATASILLSNEPRASLHLSNSEELELAEIEAIRGRRREALIHLERALGRTWIGRLHADH